MSVENITIEDAINVLSLPRELPIQETITIEIDPPPKKGEAKFKLLKDEMITVHNGPFGPYIRIEEMTAASKHEASARTTFSQLTLMVVYLCLQLRRNFNVVKQRPLF